MDGMVMPNSPDVSMAPATATSSASLALNVEATDAASASASASMGQSASMGMGGMNSYLHFGFGDSFIASFFTPMDTSGYVAVIFLLTLLAVLQRILQAFIAKTDHKLSEQVKPPHRAEPDTKAGSWIEIEEDVRSAENLSMRLKASLPRAIAASLLQVLNAAMGFLVMLGVMTLNAGYILALLAGVFLAEFALSWRKYLHSAVH